MAFTVSTIAAKDGAGASIGGGLRAFDIAGGGVGPFLMAQGIVDAVAGVERWQIDGTSNAGRMTLYNSAASEVTFNANGQATMANSAPVTIASNQSAFPVGGTTKSVSVTATTDTAAYASGDLIADTQQIDGFFRVTDGTGVIQTITIIDEEAQGAAFYILFHATSTSMGSENSAPNISDANASAGIQGMVAVATTDWVTVSGTKVACIKNISLPVKAASGADDLYFSILNSTGTPDWDADSLVLKIGALLD